MIFDPILNKSLCIPDNKDDLCAYPLNVYPRHNGASNSSLEIIHDSELSNNFFH